MSFFDNLDKKLSKLGQDALQKTREVSDTMKLTSAMKEQEQALSRLYEEIGRKYVEQYAEEAQENMSDLYGQLQEAQAKLEELRGQLSEVKGVVYCPNCHAEVSNTADFCNRCGTKLEHPESAESQEAQGKVCSNCGAPVGDDEAFCMQCGHKIEAAAEDVKETVSDAAESVAEEAESIRDAVEEKVEDVKEAVEGTANEISGELKEAAPIEKVCSSCGAVVGASQIYCTKCGTKYE